MTCTTQEMSNIFNHKRQLRKQLRKWTLLNIEYYVLHFMSQVVRNVLKRYKCRQFLLWIWSQNKAFIRAPTNLELVQWKSKQLSYKLQYCLHQHILVWSSASRARRMQWLTFLLFQFCSSLFRVLTTNYKHVLSRIWFTKP